MAATPGTLLNVYEGVFQYICLLNRLSRKGAAKSYETVRGEVLGLLEGIRQYVETNPVLRMQAEKLDLPVLFFIDSMISESRLECAAQWHQTRLAFDRNQLAGDEKFFDLLDETLADSSREATERLEFFYVCMGLGFTGWYATQPEYLRKKMETIAQRIGVPQDRRSVGYLCPEAYQYQDTRNLIEPPAGKIWLIVIVFVGFCLTAALTDYYLLRTGSQGLIQSLKEIERHDLNK